MATITGFRSAYSALSTVPDSAVAVALNRAIAVYNANSYTATDLDLIVYAQTAHDVAPVIRAPQSSYLAEIERYSNRRLPAGKLLGFFAASDETTDLAVAADVIQARLPEDGQALRMVGSLSAASSSGSVTAIVTVAGVAIGTVTILASAVEGTVEITPVRVAAGQELAVEITGAGTDAAGLKITLYGAA